MIFKTFFSRVHKVPYGRPVRTSVILLPYPPTCKVNPQALWAIGRVCVSPD